MPSTTQKRRWTEEGMKGRVPKKPKKFKKQREYHSSSEDESDDQEFRARDAPVDFQPVNMESSEDEARPSPKSILKNSTGSNSIPLQHGRDGELVERDIEGMSSEDNEDEEDDAHTEADQSEDDSDMSDASEGSEISETSTNNPARRVRKRNDPEAFATSISKILNSKLTTKNRSEPILARSKTAQETNQALADHRLTVKAHKAISAEKKSVQEKGRVKDVLGLNTTDVSTAAIVAEEKRLKRTAQKGVIKLFNAVRAAQVKAEMAQKEVQKEGVVGLAKREEKVREMSKQGFLDMIAGGGKKKEGSVEA